LTVAKPILQTEPAVTAAPDPTTDPNIAESRRSFRSQRNMSVGRRVFYSIVTPLLHGVVALLWYSYRIEKVIGDDIAEQLVTDKTVCIPCYWHQQTLPCANIIRQWIHKGFDASIVISASVDGEIPARIAGGWGAKLIRGSANQTGALVMRDMHGALKRGSSIITTPDGPKGPIFEFKAGNILIARISGAPLVPLACAADRSWRLKSWDKMLVPKPFARVVIAIGHPHYVPKDASVDSLERHRVEIQDSLMSLMSTCRDAL
jgi:lysophospholipid acyltransferase (LPLAT)-like uncharacterized protein